MSLNIPEKVLQKDFTKIEIKSTSLNDVKQNSVGKISVTQLIAPDRILLPNKVSDISPRNYYYESQQKNDYQIYDYEEFIKYFPHLPYNKNEIQPQNWKHGKAVEYQFDTEKSETVVIQSLSKGFYLIKAISMFGNDTISVEKIAEVLDDNTLKSTDNTFFQAKADKDTYIVGENVKISLISDIQNSTAIINIESGGKWLEQKVLHIENGKTDFNIQTTENHIKDGLFVSAYLVWENGYQQQNFQISVIDKPKSLKISTKTFRDKLTPGAPETWELTIAGEDKDKFTAEVLATMYDASLDAFAVNSFNFNPLSYSASGRLWRSVYFYSQYRSQNIYLSPYYKYVNMYFPQFADLKDFTLRGVYGHFVGVATRSLARRGIEMDDEMLMESQQEMAVVDYSDKRMKNEANNFHDTVDAPIADTEENVDATSQQNVGLQTRTNLQETAFFYPNLYTDQNGDVVLKFTSPEALTKWKLLVLAHTQDLHSGTAEFYTQTQKELMVTPNMPRFLREGDEVVISAKINNLSEKNLAGNAKLELFDGLTGKPLEISLQEKQFSTEINKNAEVNWIFTVPNAIQVIEYKIIAQAGEFSDGEQSILPVLPNRMLVTETMPIFAKEGQTKTFQLDKLVHNSSNSLANYKLTVEITANPLWLAVMSLPYLREYPYECSEQIFSHLYGNILSTHILNQNPKIKRVFDNWNTNEHNVSPLEKNEELKNIILEETPWVRNAQNETEQRKRLALLFDLNKMSQENAAAQQKLIQRQNADGGFPWFEGGQSSAYITEHIVQGFGQLQKMLNYSHNEYFSQNMNNLVKKAINFVDNEKIKEIKRRESAIRKSGGKIDGKDFVHYYYVRSFWKDKYPLPTEAKKYLDDINKNISEYFKNYDLQRKAMIATTLYRYGYTTSAKTIINNLRETSVEADEMGMYWKDNRAGWLWYQSPVEAQTKAIEAFAEVYADGAPLPNSVKSNGANEIEEMKIWLLKNRQTNAWNSTKATTDAVYALMNFGKDWTNAEEGVKVWVGSTVIVGNNSKSSDKTKSTITHSVRDDYTENAAGYIKQSWNAAEIIPKMGTTKVEKTSPGVFWGGIYWQYF
ncbi:MAG: hypothetical protein LBB41_03025, partial [Prevotellaceae bacterium]|nr:hypothetical protein [Prevotellaceae bacterium]